MVSEESGGNVLHHTGQGGHGQHFGTYVHRSIAAPRCERKEKDVRTICGRGGPTPTTSTEAD